MNRGRNAERSACGLDSSSIAGEEVDVLGRSIRQTKGHEGSATDEYETLRLGKREEQSNDFSLRWLQDIVRH